MNRDEVLAYKRGYNTSVRDWPKHRPPIPPDPVVGELVKALQELRDDVDSELACFAAEDEMVTALGPALDKATAALEQFTDWIRS